MAAEGILLQPLNDYSGSVLPTGKTALVSLPSSWFDASLRWPPSSLPLARTGAAPPGRCCPYPRHRSSTNCSAMICVNRIASNLAGITLKSTLLLKPLLCSFPHHTGATVGQGRSFRHSLHLPQINSKSFFHHLCTTSSSLQHIGIDTYINDVINMFDDMCTSYIENRETRMMAMVASGKWAT
ncbi:unnamed protein product [Urochloa humidicola]